MQGSGVLCVKGRESVDFVVLGPREVGIGRNTASLRTSPEGATFHLCEGFFLTSKIDFNKIIFLLAIDRKSVCQEG